MSENKFLSIIIFLIGVLLLAACTDSETPGPETSTTAAPVEQSLTPTSAEKTPTSATPDLPIAASVNGEGILLSDYEAEVLRAQAGADAGLLDFSPEDVLQEMTDQVLLSQGAADSGYTLDADVVKSRITALDIPEEQFQNWLVENHYTTASLERALTYAIRAAWMRDQIISGVPSTAEQVHARQILLYNSDEAANIFTQLNNGADFATLASQYDPLAAGSLGWFPRGYLTMPELDAAVFALKPGEYSPVVETALGFHIIQVIEYEAQRPLNPAALQKLQIQAVKDWLELRRTESVIEIQVP